MEKLIENFWIRCYLGSTQKHSIEELVINRAYRDLNRTIHGMKNIPANISKLQYSILTKPLLELSSNLMNSDFNTPTEFDTLHEQECNRLIQFFDDAYKGYNMHLHIGQAQFYFHPQFDFEITTSRAYNSLLKKQKVFSDRDQVKRNYEEEQVHTLHQIERIL